MEKVKIGETYYFNNREIVILRLENEQFAFVVGNLNIDHDITGAEFCHECLVGGCDGSHHMHTCDNAQDTIDSLMEELGDKEVFWVDIRYLNDHPFEYKKHVKLQEEIEESKKVKEDLKKQLKKIEKERAELTISVEGLKQVFEDKEKTLKKYDIEISEISEIKNKLELDANSFATIKDTNMKIPMSNLISLHESKIKLELLENGGVDNWEWYGEAIGDNDVVAMAIQEIITYQISNQKEL